MNRRNFIKNSATATALMTLENFATPISKTSNATQLKIMGTNWGFDGNTETFCAKAKAAGYDGIEMWWPTDAIEREKLFSCLKKNGLEIGFLVGDGNSDYKKNLENFTKNLEAAATNTIQRPLYINCHSGKDYFSFEQNLAFMEATNKMKRQKQYC